MELRGRKLTPRYEIGTTGAPKPGVAQSHTNERSNTKLDVSSIYGISLVWGNIQIVKSAR